MGGEEQPSNQAGGPPGRTPGGQAATARAVLGAVWRLSAPYFRSEDKLRARLLLGAIIALNLGLVGLNVLFNQWNNTFYTALQERDWDIFVTQLAWFCVLATLFIAAAVYSTYLNQMLQIRWRRWLTERYLSRWMGGRSYQRMALSGHDAADNPDQRIADDLRLFVADTLGLGLGLLSATVTLVSFVFILWGKSESAPLAIGGVTIPGYLVWVALLYALAGTWLIDRVGRPLVGLNFHQQRVEADFRFALMRVRENAEGVALLGGEAEELRGFRTRFHALLDNWWAIMVRTKRLTWWSAGYEQIAIVFPFIVVSPAYFAGRIQLGGLMQTSSAFGQVQSSLSFFISSYTRIAEWKAVVDRLVGFDTAMTQAEAMPGGPVRAYGRAEVAAEGLMLDLPDGRALASVPLLTAAAGEAVLVTGPSGTGKSTIFRALAGLWPFGHGTVRVPEGARLLFLPQRPYLPEGSLRRVLAYPGQAGDDGALRQALVDVGLGALGSRLNEDAPWQQILSGGEQQRLGFARALLVMPDALFLDEATSALDPAAETALYQLLRERLPRTAIVSIGHREALAGLHDRRMVLTPGTGGAPATLAAG